MHPMLTIATKAARMAGKIISQHIDRLDSVSITEKKHKDFVSNVDKMAEQAIIDCLRQSYPDHSILAEESGLCENQNSDYCWIIDPLDGTTNFIHGVPHFCVSIALRYKRDLEIGLVYDPIRHELFTAAKGKGAQLNNRRIRVSNCSKLNYALIGTGFPHNKTQHLKHYLTTFANILPKSSGVRRAGAAALDLAYVAAGRLDGFWESSLRPWDMAAGALLIKEAGGLISDFDGKQQFFNEGSLVAGNPKIYQAILAEVTAAKK